VFEWRWSVRLGGRTSCLVPLFRSVVVYPFCIISVSFFMLFLSRVCIVVLSALLRGSFILKWCGLCERLRTYFCVCKLDKDWMIRIDTVRAARSVNHVAGYTPLVVASHTVIHGGSGVGTMGTAGYIVPPPSSGLVPPVPFPSQRCGLCQNFKQTTLGPSYKIV